MFNKYFETMKDVEEAYKPFKIMKNGSKSDKIINIILWVLYFATSSYFFCSNVINNKSAHLVVSWIAFGFSFILLFLYTTNIQQRESIVYSHKNSSDVKQIENFVSNLNKRKISPELFEIIITFYKEKLSKFTNEKTNEVIIYLTYFILPVIINVITSNQCFHFELLIIIFIGMLLVPGIIFVVRLFINRKKNMYSNIVYYLTIYLENEKAKKIFDKNVNIKSYEE